MAPGWRCSVRPSSPSSSSMAGMLPMNSLLVYMVPLGCCGARPAPPQPCTPASVAAALPDSQEILRKMHASNLTDGRVLADPRWSCGGAARLR